MKQLGAVIVDPAAVPNFNKFGKTELEVLHYEFKADLNKYLASLGSKARVRTMEDVIQFNEENAARVMPYFGQEHLIIAQQKGPLSSKPYREALARNRQSDPRRRYRRGDEEAPAGCPCRAIGRAGLGHRSGNGDASNWDMESTAPAAVAGYPHITVPAGYVFGLPVGISFFARAWQEPTLIKLAYAFEHATQVRQAPQFLTTADLNG